MGSELAAAPQPLQVLHVSEQEEDVFAFRMGLEQPGSGEGKKQPPLNVLQLREKMTLGISVEVRGKCHTAVLIIAVGVKI